MSVIMSITERERGGGGGEGGREGRRERGWWWGAHAVSTLRSLE